MGLKDERGMKEAEMAIVSPLSEDGRSGAGSVWDGESDSARREEDGVYRFDIHNASRGCTDVLFLLLFLAMWLGMFIVAGVAVANGTPQKLVYATDWHKDTCGVGTNEDKKYIYYPLIGEPITASASVGEDGIKTQQMKQLLGICVEKCPAEREIVQIPWAFSLGGASNKTLKFPTKSVFFRCLDDYELQEFPVGHCMGDDAGIRNCGTLENRCCDEYKAKYGPNDDSIVCTPDGHFLPTGCTNDEDWRGFSQEKMQKDCREHVNHVYPECKEYAYGDTSLTNQPAGQNPIYKELQGWAQVISRWVGDMQMAAGPILVVGGLYACAAGFVWLVVCHYCAALVTWCTLIFSVLSLMSLTLYCFAKSGKFGALHSAAEVIDAELAKVPTGYSLPIHHATAADKLYWFEVAGFFFMALTIIVFSMVVWFRSRIELAVGILKEAGRALREMPLLNFFPVLPVLALLSLMIYWLVIAAYLASAHMDGNLSAADFTSDGMNATVVGEISDDRTLTYVLFYHLFGLLWTIQWLDAIEMLTIAGAISQWYWDADQKLGVAGLFSCKCCTCDSPTWQAFRRTLRYHSGTAAFGSLIIAVFQMVRYPPRTTVNGTAYTPSRWWCVTPLEQHTLPASWCVTTSLQRTVHSFFQCSIHSFFFCSSYSRRGDSFLLPSF
jgi:choline transporter-like protein 2/4/5